MDFRAALLVSWIWDIFHTVYCVWYSDDSISRRDILPTVFAKLRDFLAIKGQCAIQNV